MDWPHLKISTYTSGGGETAMVLRHVTSSYVTSSRITTHIHISAAIRATHWKRGGKELHNCQWRHIINDKYCNSQCMCVCMCVCGYVCMWEFTIGALYEIKIYLFIKYNWYCLVYFTVRSDNLIHPVNHLFQERQRNYFFKLMIVILLIITQGTWRH